MPSAPARRAGALLCAAAALACGGDATTGPPTGAGGDLVTGAGGAVDWSASAGPVGSQSASSVSSGEGGSGGDGKSCLDTGLGEPNESEETAFSLGDAIDDCDGSGSSLTGTLSADDVDWFVYEGDDGILCVVDPTRSLSQSEDGARLCKYFECLSGQADTEVTCPGGATEDTSPGGRPGCCHTQGFSVDDLNCAGSSDELAYVYIRLDLPSAAGGACNDWSLDYHY